MIDSTLLREIDPQGKLRLSACSQCGKCSSGCPMHFETDIYPHQLIRLIQVGARDEVLVCRAIWACASCAACVSRCPMAVRLPEAIDRLRSIAVNEHKADREKTAIFNESFLASVKRYGRVFEPSMLISYKVKSKDVFRDMKKMPEMLLKGKLRLLPPRGADVKALRRIFNKLEGMK